MGERLAKSIVLATFLVGHERWKPLLVWLMFVLPRPARRLFIRWWIMTYDPPAD